MISSANESYETSCETSKLMTLKKRRKLSSTIFCFDVIEGHIYVDSPVLLNKMNFFCPSRQLRTIDFLRPDHRTNHGQTEPLSSMVSDFNEVANMFEPGMNKNIFKTIVKNYIMNLN